MNSPTRDRLLILDDDEAVARTLAKLAERTGASVHWTTSAAAFYDALEEWAPTHLAVDLVMPEVDGVEVFRELAARDCRAPIIITSGASPRLVEAAARSAREHGLHIAAVLPKPLTRADLQAALASAPGLAPSSAPPAPRADKERVGVEMLAAAIDDGQIGIALQPKIDVRSSELVGFEALARWSHPEAGDIYPDEFIPLAERSELIGPLTLEVADRALTWLGATSPSADHTVAVNLSARCLGDEDLIDRLVGSCERAQVATGRVILEVTETGAMDDPVAALDTLVRCRVKGFQLSIDDFGVGYSSLVALARLPFGEMKIDRSFVMSAQASTESRSIIRAVIGLARSLGLRAVAEGVEDAATLAFLGDEGCDHAQGFHIARPLSPEDARAWIGA